MKLGLTSRLFLVLLAATALVACGMFVIMQWSIDRGFLRYVNTLDQERLERLAGELEQQLRRSRGAGILSATNRVNLLRLMVKTLPEGQVRPEHLDRLERRLERRQGRRERPEPPPPGLAHLFELRVQLLDSERPPPRRAASAPAGRGDDSSALSRAKDRFISAWCRRRTWPMSINCAFSRSRNSPWHWSPG